MQEFNISDASARPVMCVREEKESYYFPNAEKLKKGKIYNVTKVVVHPFSTDVYLREFPDLNFNSVQFGELATLSMTAKLQSR